jgi:hypothetical protein
VHKIVSSATSDPEYAVRLTVIGQCFHAVRIIAGPERAAADWRADYDALSYEVVELPARVVTGVSAFMTMTGLHHGAWDFLFSGRGARGARRICGSSISSGLPRRPCLRSCCATRRKARRPAP